MDIKKGIPLYPNLVNLKSNTMKNTVQKYAESVFYPTFRCCKTCFLRIISNWTLQMTCGLYKLEISPIPDDKQMLADQDVSASFKCR